MAVIRNITGDTRSLFHADAPPIHGAGCEDCGYPCNEVTVRDERFVERAWPTSTWELVEAPELDGYVDASTDDAIVWSLAAEKALEDLTVAELKEIVATAGIETTASKKADLIAAIAAHTPEG